MKYSSSTWSGACVCAALIFCLAVPAAAQAPAFDQATIASEARSRLYNPAAALAADGSALVLWEDSHGGVQARRVGRGAGLERATQLAVNDLPAAVPYRGPITLQRDPTVVPVERGEFLAFWTEERQEVFVDILYQDSEVVASSIQVRRFDRAGRPLGPNMPVSAGGLGLESGAQAVRLASGRVVVAWNVREGNTPQGVYARMVGGRGVPHGEAFRVDAGAEEAGRRPALAALADGGFLVAWQQCCDAGGETDVVARRFDADGAPQGAPFLIPANGSGPQVWPALAAGADGEVMAAWMGPAGGDTALEYRVYGQKLSADGTRLGSQIALSSGPGRAHGAPTLAALPDGYALVWTLWRQHFVSGVFGVALDADGVPRGEGLKLSSGSVQFQWELALATDPAGRILVAWQGFDAEGKPAIGAWTAGPDL